MQELSGIPFVIGISTTSAPVDDDRRDEIVAALTEVATYFSHLLRHTPIHFITTGVGEEAGIATATLSELGWTGWAPSGADVRLNVLHHDFDGPDGDPQRRLINLLCRYSHAIISTASHDDEPDRVVDAYRRSEFTYGDEDTLHERLALLEPPGAGVVVRLTYKAGSRRLRQRRWLKGQERNAIHLFDRTNAELQRANKDAASARRANFMPESILQEHGIEPSTAASLLETRALFGRASAAARHALKSANVVNFVAAGMPAVTVLGFEAFRTLAPQASQAAPWVYGVGLGAYFALLVLRAMRSDTEKLARMRLLAESLRMQTLWQLAGVKSRTETAYRLSAPGEVPHAEFLGRGIDFLAARSRSTLPTKADLVFDRWLQSQAAWHWYSSKHNRRAARRARMSQAVVSVLPQATLLMASIAIIAGGAAYATWDTAFRLADIAESLALVAIPIFVGGITLLGPNASHAELAKMDRRMFRKTNAATNRWESASTDEDKEAILAEFGRESLANALELVIDSTRSRRNLF